MKLSTVSILLLVLASVLTAVLANAAGNFLAALEHPPILLGVICMAGALALVIIAEMKEAQLRRLHLR